MNESYTIEAILRVRDQGYSKGFERAAGEAQGFVSATSDATKNARGFRDTMLGMASAIGITKAVGAAWTMVKNSVGSAMARIDTMEQFSRTIETMTGDTQLATLALDALRNASRGTAYGLDVMAKATQGFVSSGYDVLTVTGFVENWGNAVALYGDGSNATLERVTYQLNQMAAKGKANLGDLKSAMEAGIPVTQIYAEAVDMSTEEVAAALSSGKISAQDFFSTMDRAFREGSASFPVLTGAAKSAGSSWSASFSNMRAATTRGMTNIIQSIEKARKDANLPGMKDAVSGFGLTLERILTGVGRVLGFAARHFETFGTIALTAFTAFAGYKAAVAATDAIKKFSDGVQQSRGLVNAWLDASGRQVTAVKAYDVAIKSATTQEQIRAAATRLGITLKAEDMTMTAAGIALTEKQKIAIMAETGALTLKSILLSGLPLKQKAVAAAQLLWNKALAANPIGVAIVAITAFVGMVKLLARVTGQANEEYVKAKETAKEMAGSLDEATSSSKKLRDSYRDTTNDTVAVRREASTYIQQLKDIESSSDGAFAKQEKMQAVLSNLSRLYPDLTYEIDEMTGSLIGGTDALELQMDAMDAAAKRTAMQEALSEAYKRQVDLETAIAASTNEMRRQEETGQSLGWVVTAFGKTLASGPTKEYKELQTKIAEATAELGLNEQHIEALMEALGVMSEEQHAAALAADEHARSQEVLTAKFGVTTDAIVAFAEKTGEPLDEVGQQVVELASRFELSTDEVIAAADESGMALGDWAKKFDDEVSRASAAITKHADIITNGFEKLEQKSTISLNKYAENLRENQRAVDQWADNTETLMLAGVDQGIIAQLARLGPEGAAQAKRFVDELEALNKGALGKFDELTPAAQDKILTLQEAFQSGMTSAANAGRVALQAEDYVGMGEFVPSEMARGLVRGQKIVLEDSKALALTATKGLSGIASTFDRTGYDAGMGLRNGLSRSARSIYSTANTIANGVAATMRKALQTRSPSRVTEVVGEHTGQGLVLGMDKTTKDVLRSAKNLALAAIPSIDSGSSRVGTGAASGVDAIGHIPQGAAITLVMAGKAFRAFVADITSAQNQEAELMEVYA